MRYLAPHRDRVVTVDADATTYLALRFGQVRVVRGRAGDDPTALVQDGSHYRASGIIVPGGVMTPPSARTLYAEPADPWTAYPWVDGQLDITDTWLEDPKNNVRQITENGIPKWLVSGLSRRNMNSSQNAVKIKTNRWVKVISSQLMAAGGSGAGVGLIGSTWGGARWELEDCSLYGPYTHLATGQFAGAVAPTDFFAAHVRHCNFWHARGVQSTKIRPSEGAGDGLFVEFNSYYCLDGRIRNTGTATGWGMGHVLGVDRVWTQAVQLSGMTVRGPINFRVAWNRTKQIYGDSQVEDTVNTYGASATASNRAYIEDNLIDSAYPVGPDIPYSGGGLLVADEGGEYWTIRRNTILETINYGAAVAGGNFNTIEDNIILGTGLSPLGEILDRENGGYKGDAGVYIRNYSGDARIVAETYAARNLVRWGRPTNSNPDARWDFSVNPLNGTMIDNDTSPPGRVTEADLEAARQAWEARRAAAGIIVGRRNPAI